MEALQKGLKELYVLPIKINIFLKYGSWLFLNLNVLIYNNIIFIIIRSLILLLCNYITCRLTSSEKIPPFATSSSKEPTSATRPESITMILSQLRMVESL